MSEATHYAAVKDAFSEFVAERYSEIWCSLSADERKKLDLIVFAAIKGKGNIDVALGLWTHKANRDAVRAKAMKDQADLAAKMRLNKLKYRSSLYQRSQGGAY